MVGKQWWHVEFDILDEWTEREGEEPLTKEEMKKEALRGFYSLSVKRIKLSKIGGK